MTNTFNRHIIRASGYAVTNELPVSGGRPSRP